MDSPLCEINIFMYELAESRPFNRPLSQARRYATLLCSRARCTSVGCRAGLTAEAERDVTPEHAAGKEFLEKLSENGEEKKKGVEG